MILRTIRRIYHALTRRWFARRRTGDVTIVQNFNAPWDPGEIEILNRRHARAQERNPCDVN